MGYLTLNIPSNTIEIILKDDRGSTRKIDVTATLNSELGPKVTGRSINVVNDALQKNENDLDLPNIEEIRQRLHMNEDISKSNHLSLANIPRDENGLPLVEELRKLL